MFKLSAGLMALAMLTACATPEGVYRTTLAVNAGQSLPPEMERVNLLAVVAFDEADAATYNRHSQAVLYSQGVSRDSPEYRLRVVRINFNHFKGNLVWADGTFLFSSAAVVPDHLPPLKAGDLVEVRHVRTWESLKQFSLTGEGNRVLRVWCEKASPQFQNCLDAAPRIGRVKGQGPTGTAFPESPLVYGHTFTPRNPLASAGAQP